MSAATEVLAQEFDAELLKQGSPSDTELLSVQTASTLHDGNIAMGVRGGLAKDPLVAVDSENNETVAKVIGRRAFVEVAAAYGLGPLEFYGALPVIMHQDSQVEDGVMLPVAAENAGIGDLRLGTRWRFYGEAAGLGLALSGEVTMPTHARAELAGDNGVSVHPRIAGEFRTPNFLMALNIGIRVRPTERLGDLRVGTAFTYGVGGAWQALGPVSVIGELVGEVSGGDLQNAPVEFRSGVRVAFSRFAVAAGYGRGVARGHGAPAHRGFARVSVAFGNEPEGPGKQIQQQDPDPDGDKIYGTSDDCPTEPEDLDGFHDLDGCPELDNDNDGVEDKDDKCKNSPEDLDGFEDADGCPESDNDGDGILDTVDDCPNKAEVINGNDDDDGCPDSGRRLVIVEQTRIRIIGNIDFRSGTANLAPGSRNVISQLARTLVRDVSLSRVRIEGHTDDRGNDGDNLLLSQRRADAVRDALVAQGVAPGRLETIGLGEKKPIASNRTRSGRARNQRIEVVIVKRSSAGGRQ